MNPPQRKRVKETKKPSELRKIPESTLRPLLQYSTLILVLLAESLQMLLILDMLQYPKSEDVLMQT